MKCDFCLTKFTMFAWCTFAVFEGYLLIIIIMIIIPPVYSVTSKSIWEW